MQEHRVYHGISATFVNHSTVLLQVNGFNILTDPIWSLRCSPLQFIGPKRVRNPAISFDNLPEIHIVLISHNHYDHFDLHSVRKLIHRFNPIFVMGIGNEKLFKGLNANVLFLDWWETKNILSEFCVHFLPAQHFSGRTLWDRDKGLWGSFMIETTKGKIYFAGDTGYSSHFSEIYERVGSPKFALLPIGAYSPRWFMSHVHMNPDDAVRAHLDLHAETSMGIHFGTFQLTDEGIDEPKTDLMLALEKYQVNSKNFLVPEFGETHLIF